MLGKKIKDLTQLEYRFLMYLYMRIATIKTAITIYCVAVKPKYLLLDTKGRSSALKNLMINTLMEYKNRYVTKSMPRVLNLFLIVQRKININVFMALIYPLTFLKTSPFFDVILLRFRHQTSRLDLLHL